MLAEVRIINPQAPGLLSGAAQGGIAVEHMNRNGEAAVKRTFTGDTGTCRVKIAYCEKNDGAPPMGFRVDGIMASSWTADEQPGSPAAAGKTLTLYGTDLQLTKGQPQRLMAPATETISKPSASCGKVDPVFADAALRARPRRCAVSRGSIGSDPKSANPLLDQSDALASRRPEQNAKSPARAGLTL